MAIKEFLYSFHMLKKDLESYTKEDALKESIIMVDEEMVQKLKLDSKSSSSKKFGYNFEQMMCLMSSIVLIILVKMY